ncbi:Phosphoinositide phosphatase sac1 [Dipsacomyces acuminosporus]|nr:Phosphoinositide phosphatase sac1 [Dipsacomyces acuminosporus]
MVTAQQSFKISFYQATVTVEAARGSGGEYLVIDRTDGSVRVATPSTAASAFAAAPQRTVSAHGVLGLVSFLRGPYIVLITGREAVGSIGSSTIYKVTETKVVKVAADSRVVSGFDAIDEATYLRLLEDALAAESFYFSYEFDLTNSLERQQKHRQRQAASGNANAPLYKTASDEFFYNKYLSEPIIEAVKESKGAGIFVIPAIHGFIEHQQAVAKGTVFNYILITRRGRKRQGTRYFSRGADEDGNVSNFAETEQIVDFPAGGASDARVDLAGTQLSYVQVRGSIPVSWAQVINMKYVPTLKVDVDSSRARFSKHISRLIDQYGEIVAVNLVNKKKYEKPMGDAFATLSQEFKSPLYHYTHFDFHKECSKMRWDRISILVDELAEYNAKFGYFRIKNEPKAAGPAATPSSLQLGVIRSNCMDCLDRTNVIQSELARTLLTKQLRDLDVFSDTDTIGSFPEMQSMLRNVWADNADAVSCAYSGTGALKTDFTRTGQRTKAGALQDARNSVERYVRGNFFDGERQDSIDLLLGRFTVKPGPTPFANDQTLESKTLVAAVCICLSMLVYAFFYPRSGHWFAWSNIFFTNAWLVVLAVVLRTIMQSHTAELLNWPKLTSYPYRPAVMRANATLSLPLLDRVLASSDTKASLRGDEIKKAWPSSSNKKLA